jgi:hypothetical protein
LGSCLVCLRRTLLGPSRRRRLCAIMVEAMCNASPAALVGPSWYGRTPTLHQLLATQRRHGAKFARRGSCLRLTQSALGDPPMFPTEVPGPCPSAFLLNADCFSPFAMTRTERPPTPLVLGPRSDGRRMRLRRLPQTGVAGRSPSSVSRSARLATTGGRPASAFGLQSRRSAPSGG